MCFYFLLLLNTCWWPWCKRCNVVIINVRFTLPSITSVDVLLLFCSYESQDSQQLCQFFHQHGGRIPILTCLSNNRQAETAVGHEGNSFSAGNTHCHLMEWVKLTTKVWQGLSSQKPCRFCCITWKLKWTHRLSISVTPSICLMCYGVF